MSVKEMYRSTKVNPEPTNTKNNEQIQITTHCKIEYLFGVFGRSAMATTGFIPDFPSEY
jgi:alcohol dehydrogenase YqhD (iron-dependent ADH family)